MVFAQGFRVITEALARSLQIATGQVVREIHWQSSPVRVLTQNSEYLADRVVLTLPLGVLQAGSVRFVPELPATKRTAIAALGMGVLNRCYLRFPKAFWDSKVDWLEVVPERPGEWTEWLSLQRALGKPVLLGFNAGDRGQAIESLSDAQIVDSAMATLRKLYGGAIPAPGAYQITRWAAPPLPAAPIPLPHWVRRRSRGGIWRRRWTVGCTSPARPAAKSTLAPRMRRCCQVSG